MMNVPNEEPECIVIDDEDDKPMLFKTPRKEDTGQGTSNSMKDTTTPDLGHRLSSLAATVKSTLPNAKRTFQSLGWGSDAASLGRQYRIGGTFGSRRPLTPCPSPGSMSFSRNHGSSEDPIELDDADDDLRCINAEQDENELGFGEQKSRLVRAILTKKDHPHPMTPRWSSESDSEADREAIELDSQEDRKNAFRAGIVPEDAVIICLEDIYNEDEKLNASTTSSKQDRKQSSKTVKFEERNPAIIAPFKSIPETRLDKLTLRPNKTVELKDEGFLTIKDIIYNSETMKVKLRGHRLHRARHLNGLLSCKLNETVLFLEVDLDDPRDPLVQGAVEVPLDEVVKIRHVHFTNHLFPENRKFQPKQFNDPSEGFDKGGLTTRWKYTCTYASASDRYQNIFRERTLERVKPGDCLPVNAVSDEIQRFQWRGETVRGGSYQPAVDGHYAQALPSEEVFLRMKNVGNGKRKASYDLETEDRWIRKRVRSDLSGSTAVEDSGETGVEDTRRRLSDVHLELHSNTVPEIIDLTEDVPELSPSAVDSQSSALPKVLDLTNLDGSTENSITYTPPSPLTPIQCTANQTYTYGDAFCGAGGSTRGALLAGLHPKWGFDFSPHASASWTANFPSGVCYNTAAHTFIWRASTPTNLPLFKVDILHLSPPCQFFSPAHTVNGVDDESNTASLFAVAEMIKATKPRIVTLEQTFGILCSKHKWYFRSLVEMFTSQNFGVRWAVVPLAQWGLPQRRNRLIIIASCPGEILPRMPLATHSSSDPTLQPLISANHTLSLIPSTSPSSPSPDPLHNPHSPSLLLSNQMTPWDGSKILPRAMTTSGGQNYHPSGLRDLTLREYACLQGFPLEHVFKGNYVKKQIGNAVPPCVARVLFESIKRDLEVADGVVGGCDGCGGEDEVLQQGMQDSNVRDGVEIAELS